MPNNPLSNTSYTNKDFNAIYVELLDLVKKLTYKWDPSISNESDPGNILLKLNAIIGDKNNYNIDKNILENFPETLTQDISARSLYKQLAYKMPWYQSATTDVTFKWCGTDNAELLDTSGTVTIDKFQLISDANTEFVFTTLNDVSFNKWNKTQTVKAIEGVINTLNINGQEIIELNNIDHYNRIYFDETTIAENGIFIYNVNGSTNDYWKMVDNLQVEPLGNKYYEFGIDSRRNLCYIEFPSDINTLIGNGLIIKYIVSSGSQGNIISRTLDRFYKDVSLTVNGEDVVLDGNVIQISNASGTTNGRDPEDLDTAYKNYRKTAGTFHTLVTLRDYINAIYNSGLVSNVKVCDRLNDVQSTYTIVPDDTYSSDVVTQIATSQPSHYIGYAKVGSLYKTKPAWSHGNYFYYDDGEMIVPTQAYFDLHWQDCYYLVDNENKDLKAFDLKLYLLHSPGVVNSFESYKSTFDMEPSKGDVEANVVGYINEERCVQHDFQDILPEIPCMFKNSFPLVIKIIPHYKLGEDQVSELKININKALFNKLNSSCLQFGEEANYDEIYDIIYNADERIKVLILDDFVYTTFATYWDSVTKTFKDIPISEFNSGNIILIDDTNFNGSQSDLNNYIIKTIESHKDTLGDYLYNNTYFIQKSNNYVYRVENNQIVLYSTLINSFRTDILAKSVLGGRTPYVNMDTLFTYTIDQNKQLLKDTDKISTYMEVYPHGFESNTNRVPKSISKDNFNSLKTVEYNVQANENIRFLAPSFATKKTFSNYVKYELILNSSSIETKEIALKYNTYSNSKSEFDSKPITYYTDNSGSYTGKSTLEIPYNINYVEYVIDDDADLGNSFIHDYLNRKVTVKDSNGNVVTITNSDGETVTEISLFALISKDGKDIATITTDGDNEPQVTWNDEDCFLYKWSQGNYNVESKLYISDLSEQDISLWEIGTNYVSYEIQVGNIPSNSDYELKNDEYITFFYKTEDSDDAPYIYEKFGKGTIIKPSFSVQGVAKSNAIINVDNLATTDKIPYNDLPNSPYQKIYGMYNYNDLSGTKSIAIRGLNETEIKPSEKHYYYFITANTNEDKTQYILQPDSKGQYILNNEEYFIHINAERTAFEMLGAGTLLRFYTKDINNNVNAYTKQLSVNVVDPVEVANKGLSSFVDSCKLMDFYSLIREQQIYNFSEGDTLIFTINDKAKQSIESGKPLTAICIKTGENTPITDYDITYKSGTTTDSLPKITLSDEEAVWNVTAVLNIYCSYDEPQIIETINKDYSGSGVDRMDQCYKKITIDGIDYSPIDSQTGKHQELYMLSNVALNKIGGTNIDITYLDSYGRRTKTYIFVYTTDDDFDTYYNQSLLSKNFDGSVTVSLNKAMVKDNTLGSITYHNMLQLPEITGFDENYNMLLKITNKNEDIQFVITDESDIIRPINCYNDTLNDGVYYYVIEGNNKHHLTLFFNCDRELQDTDQIIIDQIYKFRYNPEFMQKYGIDYASLQERILYFDIDNIFDYTHKVKEDYLIKDPLEAKSFFTSSHIFNDFTLPMADLYMSSQSQSNITLINNR